MAGGARGGVVVPALVIALGVCGCAGQPRQAQPLTEQTVEAGTAATVTVDPPQAPGMAASGAAASGAAASGAVTTAAAATGPGPWQEFFRRAAVLDADLRAAAALVAADSVTGPVRPATTRAVEALYAEQARLGRTVPGGADDRMLSATLLVWSGLAARAGALEAMPSWAQAGDVDARVHWRACSATVARAQDRYRADLAALQALATRSPSTPASAASAASAASGRVALLLQAASTPHHSAGNHPDCDAPITGRLPVVVWHGRDGGPAQGTLDGVAFSATYRPSDGWRISYNDD